MSSSYSGTSITVCLATMQRRSVIDTLWSLERQIGLDEVRLDVVVADNDDGPSAQSYVREAAAAMRLPVAYVHAPARNISTARNACLDAAAGDWIAFIDDDEVAAPDWLARMLAAARRDNASVVLGPAIAEYPDEAPVWMRAQDHHSNRPVRRAGKVQTGHTCNALVRRADPRIRNERFRRDKGRSGGEDTEYFFRLWKQGVHMTVAEDAKVFEAVHPDRLNYRWIARRKFRAGQSYGYHSLRENTPTARMQLFVVAAMKVVFCTVMAALLSLSEGRRNFWTLRANMHAGVIAAIFGKQEEELYSHT